MGLIRGEPLLYMATVLATFAAGWSIEAMSASEGASLLAGPQLIAQSSEEGAGENANFIPPSTVYRIAMQYVPGCTVLRVSLDRTSQTYAVKVKSGNEVRKLFVNARTGEVMGN